MRTYVLIIVGTVLMAGCGSAIASRLGLTGLQTALVAGFAVGIALLAQAPGFALRSRIDELEDKVAALSKNAA